VSTANGGRLTTLKISGYKTRAVFERYNIVDDEDISESWEDDRGVSENEEERA
jgi:hypothetical protein